MPLLKILKNVFAKGDTTPAAHFIRYGLVSGIAFSTDVALLVVCHEVFKLPYLVAATISFLIGVVVNYTLCIVWIFPESRFASRGVEFALTALIAGFGLLINNGVMWLLVSKLAVYYLAAKLVSSIVVFFWNFFIRKYYVHAPASKLSEATD